MKDKFIRDEIYTLSWSAAVGRSKIYKENIGESERLEIKNFVKSFIDNNFISYYQNTVNDKTHNQNIINLSKELSKKFTTILYDNVFRIGTSQKVLNLYLKYLWCMDKIQTPPHCPIDGVILNILAKRSLTKDQRNIFSISWTKLNDIDEYFKIIQEARTIVGSDLSSWELKYWSS